MKGDAINLVRRVEGVDYATAVAKCEQITGVKGVSLEKKEAKPVRVSGAARAREMFGGPQRPAIVRNNKRKW